MAPALKAKKRRILVVEDDPSLKETLRKHLVRRGYDVEVCGDSETALRLIATHKPDLVCLDLNLPRESGYEVCEMLRKRLETRELPIVMMSDRTSPEDRAHAEEAGANAYLTKPVTLAELTRQVSTLLDGARVAGP